MNGLCCILLNRLCFLCCAIVVYKFVLVFIAHSNVAFLVIFQEQFGIVAWRGRWGWADWETENK